MKRALAALGLMAALWVGPAQAQLQSGCATSTVGWASYISCPDGWHSIGSIVGNETYWKVWDQYGNLTFWRTWTIAGNSYSEQEADPGPYYIMDDWPYYVPDGSIYAH